MSAFDLVVIVVIEILAALRPKGLASITNAATVVLKTSGDLSVLGGDW